MEDANRGFSLVELIIIIAIIALLVATLAPQLIKYVEKTRVSSDVQLCDTIHTALITAMADPSVLASADDSSEWRNALTSPDNDFRLDSKGGFLDCEFVETVKGQLGFDPFANASNNYKYIKSKPASSSGIICVRVNSSGTAFAVYIANSDITGKGVGHNPAYSSFSYETIESTEMIFAK